MPSFSMSFLFPTRIVPFSVTALMPCPAISSSLCGFVREISFSLAEIFSVNPYRLYGKGSILIGTPSGEKLVFKLEKLGFMAAVIGQAERGIARKLYSGENFRYLERPSKDELKGVVTTWQD